MAMLCGMLIQLFKGYFALEPGLYLQALFLIKLPQYALIAVLAIALQVLINHKYLAYFAMILYYAATLTFGSLGLDHPMLLYGTSPDFIYSAMNGFGHYLARERWFELYWAGAALMLLVLSLVFWPRGYNAEIGSRLQLARRNLSVPVLAAFAPAGDVRRRRRAAVLQPARGQRLPDRLAKGPARAQYEQRYKQFAAAPQPRITDVNLQVDIVPERRTLRVRGAYQLENRSGAPIGELFVQQAAPASCDALLAEARGCCWPTRTRLLRLPPGHPAGAGREHGARIRPDRRAAGHPRARHGHPGGRQRHLLQQRRLPHIGYQPKRRTGRRARPQAPRPGRRARRCARRRPGKARPTTSVEATPTGSISTPSSAPARPDRDRARHLEQEWMARAAATSTTRWTSRSSISTPSSRRATKCGTTAGRT
jgi:hypothetical protein